MLNPFHAFSRDRRRLTGFTCALLFAGLIAPGAAAAQQGRVPAAQFDPLLDSVSRLVAGMPPSDPGYAELARRPSWKEHSRALQASWSQVRDGQLAALSKWRRAEIAADAAVSPTLLYPFSGPDFINAYWLFPGSTTYVLFGLEPIGEVPDLQAMSAPEFSQYLRSLRSFMINIFVRNYFVTRTMRSDFQEDQLRGVVPVLLASMALSEARILKVTPVDLPGARSGPRREGARGAYRANFDLKGVMIDFRGPGSAQPQRLIYYSLDATNTGLKSYPEFLDHLRGLAPTATLIKSASYLLHNREFSRIRDVLLETTTFLVQDDTGLPYSLLLKQGWQTKLYGNYQFPIQPFEWAFQPTLAAAYTDRRPRALPFLFGYQVDHGSNRSNLLAARAPSGESRAAYGPKNR
jgi:hypothetical protein